MMALPSVFGTTSTNLTVFEAPCNEVSKYFNTGAHLQYMGQNAVVELFSHLASKWPKWCAQTLQSFSRILKIFSGISALPSDDFSNLFIRW